MGGIQQGVARLVQADGGAGVVIPVGGHSCQHRFYRVQVICITGAHERQVELRQGFQHG